MAKKRTNKKGAIALKKIRTRAKAMRKENPNMEWRTAIKKSSAEYRAGTLGKKNKFRQTGTSNRKRDEERHAKTPGKRKTTRKGKKTFYYERRKNRSDRPGQLTGMSNSSYNHVILSYIRSSNIELGQQERYLGQLQERLKRQTDKREKNLTKGYITRQKKLIRSTKHEIRMQKALLR